MGNAVNDRYNSMWDKSTWLIIGFIAAWCIAIYLFNDDDIWTAAICLLMLAFVILSFTGIYYRIDGDRLVVYTFFIPTTYPINKIKEIKPTKSINSATET